MSRFVHIRSAMCVLVFAMILFGATCGTRQSVNGTLSTRWADDVSPKEVLPEYPRPQMVRQEWKNLNGLWQFATKEQVQEVPVGRDLPDRILVPFAVESALSWIHERSERVWYRRTFELPNEWDGQRVLLHFGAVDWEATVYINGEKMGTHQGGYDPFRFDITGALKPSGPQELIVEVFDPTDQGDQPRGKQSVDPKGIWYTSVTGIWQTVWLEPVPSVSIRRLKLVPDVDAGVLHVSLDCDGEPSGHMVRAVAFSGGERIASAEGAVDSKIRLPIPEAKLWSPTSPFLYDLQVTLLKDAVEIDSVASYFGMRKIEIVNQRYYLNGKELLPMCILDHGYWPEGLYTAPTDEALKYDIEITKRLGFQMTRKHAKVEPARWYYWCDRLGLLVWQEMPGSGSLMKLDGRTLYDRSIIERPRSRDSAKQFEKELVRMVQNLRNHPSVLGWVIFNAGWGQYDTARVAEIVKQEDPTRLVTCVSGWNLLNRQGFVVDVYGYPGPGETPDVQPQEVKGLVMFAEFGALGMHVDGHTWSQETWARPSGAWGGSLFRSSEELTQAYTELRGWLWGKWTYGRNPGWHKEPWGDRFHVVAFYTQLTDVESEVTGLVTYDRAVIKVDVDKVARANRGEFTLPEGEQE